jgi:mRNA-degrading endonuclease toxin of MazEF toxin-antitoxin module
MDSHVFIDKKDCIGLWESGMAMCEQLRCIDRSQVVRKIASINKKELLHRINLAIQKHFGVEEEQR